jgi:GNAT superfamily N-acetyltransferase
MKIVYTNGKNSDFIELCELLDDNLNEIMGEEKQREQYVQYNTLEDINDVILIYNDKDPVACASFKFYDEHTAEVKRVFVCKAHRGKGIAKHLMGVLEKRAKDKGYSKLILETGAPLVEAMVLYKKLEYKIIKNYGQYKEMQDSICMEKYI